MRAVDTGSGFRDTDEQDLGEYLPNYSSFEENTDGGSPPAVMVEDEALLDLGTLGTAPTRGELLDSGAYEALKVDGARPNEAVSIDRRLTPTLLKIFHRRRQQIRLSLDQLERLSGIELATLEALDHGRARSISYDQVVVLARVLGIGTDQLPGLRPREARPHLAVVLADLEGALLAAPLLRFEGQHGERYGGDVERAISSKTFTVRIEDEALDPVMVRGSLLGFMSGVQPRAGGILLLRHRRSALLAMRRYEPPSYGGLVPWQPAYVIGGEWHVVGSLEVVLPPR